MSNAMTHVWRSENNIVETVISFYLYLNTSGQTHIVRVEQEIIWVTSPVLNSF